MEWQSYDINEPLYDNNGNQIQAHTIFHNGILVQNNFKKGLQRNV